MEEGIGRDGIEQGHGKGRNMLCDREQVILGKYWQVSD